MRLSRLLAIISILSNREKVTSTELAKRFEVSVRTIIRDMNTINEAGIPIVSYQGYEGGYGLVEDYVLDKSVMTNEEINMAIHTLKGINNVLNNNNIKNIIEKFEHLDDKTKHQSITIDFSSWGIEEIEKNKLSMLNKAIESKNCVEIEYLNINGEYSKRIIEPQQLIFKIYAWYIYAYCRYKKDFRLFKVRRITSIHNSSEEFNYREYSIDDSLIDKRTSDKYCDLVLKFHLKAKNKIYDYFGYNCIDKIEGDSIIVKVSFPEDEWVYSTILSFGDNVEVIKPIRVREIIKKRINNMMNNYSLK